MMDDCTWIAGMTHIRKSLSLILRDFTVSMNLGEKHASTTPPILYKQANAHTWLKWQYACVCVDLYTLQLGWHELHRMTATENAAKASLISNCRSKMIVVTVIAAKSVTSAH